VSELPEGWTEQALGSVADCRLGKMLDAEKNQGELRPYLRNTNVQWGTIDLSDVKEMRIIDDERDRYAVLPGDLLVCEGGEPGRCAVWRDDRGVYIQKALHRVRPLNGTSVEYLRWFLQPRDMKRSA
jgi:type I restriction enzyme S subunit